MLGIFLLYNSNFIFKIVIFDFKKCDFEIRVRGHSRSFARFPISVL